MKKVLLFLTIALSFSIHTYGQIGITQPTDYEVCDDGNGLGVFELTIKDAEILNGLNPAQYTVSYYLTLQDASNDTNPLPSPYTNTTNPETIYARVFDNTTGNFEVTSFDLIINPTPIPTIQDVYSICDGDSIVVDSGLFDQEFEFAWYYDGFYMADETNSSLVVSQTGIYGLQLTSFITGCTSYTDFEVVPETLDNLSNPSPYEVCDDDGDGFYFFNLESKIDEILDGNQNPTLLVSFHETQADADAGVNALSSPYVNVVTNFQTLFVRVQSIQGECTSLLTLDLIVNTDCVVASPVTVNICAGDATVGVEIDLTTEETTILNGQNPSDYTIAYYQSEADAENQVNAIANAQQYDVFSSTILFVRVDDNLSDNYAIVTYNIVFNPGPQVYLEDSYTICGGDSIVLTPSINSSQGYSFLWSTGSTDPEIVVDIGGIYTVMVTDDVFGCSVELSTEVFENPFPELGDASDLSSCEPNATFDLTVTLDEILVGLDASQFEINYFNNTNDAFMNVNAIQNPTVYLPGFTTETILVRIQNIGDDCFEIIAFNVILEDSCPVIFDCVDGSINNSFCYDNNNLIQYTYENTDGLPLQVIFNEGRVENNYDELVILDSDGVTNLNPEATTYGNNGDISGLTFISTGSSITITVTSDGSISCENSNNYTPIDYDISCADPNALPSCNSVLITPQDGEMDVLEITDLSWSNASGIVEGYKLSIGLTSGGTEVIDNEDVGNIMTYDLETLDFETTYYVTIVPYNINGDAEGCEEQSFTTRANPNQTVVCEDGALNTTYCYDNDDTSEFGFQSSDGLPLTIVFNSGSTEVNFDEVYVVDSDGTILNPNLPYGNDGDFTGLTYTSSGDFLTVRFDSDFTISCGQGSNCCTAEFDFDVFCASSVGFIQVNAFVDANANTIYDVNEFSFSNGYFTYEINGDGMINTVNSSTGHFQIISGNETDVYDITFNLYDESEACYDITTAVFNDISVATGSTVTLDFPVVEEQSCEDLAVYLINNWAPPRPGFTHNNYLYLENLGFTNIASGTVEFVIDPQLVFNNTFSVDPTYTITNTATGFTLDFVNLQPGDVESIGISITCPVSIALGDIVTNTATYLTDTNDMVLSNNYSTLSEVVVGSWDPNDKMESHGPDVVYDEFSVSDEWLYYTIRFQNLGTAEAIFVRIEDALDDQLNKDTFQMLRASHDYVVTRTENDLEWYFEDINLPAEQDDAEGSNGYVYFRIKPMSGYGVGDVIPNTAAIYFDFNAPVITNRFETRFIEPLSVDDFEAVDFSLYPNPANDKVTIALNNNTINNFEVTLVDIQGKVISTPRVVYDRLLELDVSSLNAGMYFVQLRNANTTVVQKLIIE